MGILLQIWEKDYNFANADRLSEAPVRGWSGWESVAERHKCLRNYILEKRLSALILDHLKPGKLQIGVKNETTVDAYKDCIPTAEAARERHASAMIYIFCVRLLRCPFNSNGQFQGLKWWDGQRVSALTLELNTIL